MGTVLAFSLFALITIGSALIALFHRSVVHSAFALLGTLLGVAGFYLLLGSDFLAMVQVLLYAGGILVLILFGLMLTPADNNELKLGRVFGGILLVGGGALLFFVKLAGISEWMAVDDPADLPAPAPTVSEIGLEFLRRDSWLLPFEFASVILLAALVGSVYIARRRFKPEEPA